MGELLTPIKLLAHRLSGGFPLSRTDIEALSEIAGHVTAFPKSGIIVDQGEKSATVWLLGAGFARRQRQLPDGRRQIIALMLPGELSEKGPMLPFGSPDAIVAASDVTAQPLDRRKLWHLAESHPRILESLFYEELNRHAMSREWIVLLGQRTARERVAYFFYETYARLNAMGLAGGASFELPLTQTDLGDIVGLSAVHVNRVVKILRDENLIDWTDKVVHLPDPGALAKIAGFNPEIDELAKEFKTRASRSDWTSSQENSPVRRSPDRHSADP